MAGSDLDGGFPAGVAAPVSGRGRLHYGWVVVGVAFVSYRIAFLVSLGSFAVSAACFWLAGMARRPGSSRPAGVV